MSRSEQTFTEQDIAQLHALTDALSGLVNKLRNCEDGWPVDLGFEEAGRLLGLASRIYTIAAEAQGESVALPSLDVTATDAVVCCAALLKDQNLTPFEMTTWYARVSAQAMKSNSWGAGVEPNPLDAT